MGEECTQSVWYVFCYFRETRHCLRCHSPLYSLRSHEETEVCVRQVDRTQTFLVCFLVCFMILFPRNAPLPQMPFTFICIMKRNNKHGRGSYTNFLVWFMLFLTNAPLSQKLFAFIQPVFARRNRRGVSETSTREERRWYVFRYFREMGCCSKCGLLSIHRRKQICANFSLCSTLQHHFLGCY